MPLRKISKKLKFSKIGRIRAAPRWADIRKFGLKKVRSRRINIFKKRWKRTRIKV